MNTWINFFIDIISLFLLLIIGTSFRKVKMLDISFRKLYFFQLVELALVLFFDAFAWLFEGVDFLYSTELLMFLNTAFSLVRAAFCTHIVIFVDVWLSSNREAAYKRAKIFVIPGIIEIILIIINIETGWLFTIENSHYIRGEFYLPNLLFFCVYIVSTIIVCIYAYIKAEDQFKRRKCISMILYMLLPNIGSVLEIFFYGIALVFPLSALAVLMIYMDFCEQELVQQQLNAKKASIRAAYYEKELTKQQVAIMVSQIQPHFLYNALSSIAFLCKKNPAMAEKASIDFAEFLRGNLDALTEDKPIAFEQELAHTKKYLSLEKMRFGDRLNVIYNIETVLFRIPTLTIQPLVENAVRCGIMKRKEGGTITISTHETEGAYIVTIKDDGVGFDINRVYDDGKNHIGIKNVETRLAQMIGGRLEIITNLNEGTVATITIWKEKCK